MFSTLYLPTPKNLSIRKTCLIFSVFSECPKRSRSGADRFLGKEKKPVNEPRRKIDLPMLRAAVAAWKEEWGIRFWVRRRRKVIHHRVDFDGHKFWLGRRRDDGVSSLNEQKKAFVGLRTTAQIFFQRAFFLPLLRWCEMERAWHKSWQVTHFAGAIKSFLLHSPPPFIWCFLSDLWDFFRVQCQNTPALDACVQATSVFGLGLQKKWKDWLFCLLRAAAVLKWKLVPFLSFL